MEKGALFIDGGYLIKTLKNSYNKQKIDYVKLSNYIFNKLGLERLRTYYYDCMPIVNEKDDSSKLLHSNKQRFIDSLKRLPRFEVKLGKLQYIAGRYKQKMIDVLMSLDITNMSYEKQIQHAIMIVGDADFVPATKKAKDYGVITHLYYHPSSVHSEILDVTDELHEINQELISFCKIE